TLFPYTTLFRSSREAARAREASRGMVASQVGLALACGGLGLGAQAVLGPLSRIVADGSIAPHIAATWNLPLPLLTLLLGAAVFSLAAWMASLARARPVRRYITWE